MDTRETAAPPPRSPDGRAERFHRIGIYRFIALALLPTVCLLALVYWYVDDNLQEIKTAAESTHQVHLPGILKNQRTLINIESLRRYVETVYNASDAEIRRDALVNALALATESVFEANSRFVEYATSAKSLLYALDAVKKRSDRAQEELARAARLFVQTEARLGVYAGEDRHEAMPAEDDARVSERVLAYCGKLRAAPGPLPQALAQCVTLRESRQAMEKARQRHSDADTEARELWKQFDQLLRKLSDLASSKEAEATHWAMEYISKSARRTHFVFYLSGVLIVLIFCVFILVLHRYILSPLTLASRSLRRIRDGGRVENLPPVRVRELQDMLNILPVVSRHVTDLSARSGLLEQEKDRFRNLSLVDGLTGAGNRRHFDACLARSGRDRPLALLMLDVDMFKLYNDAYGHLAGDSALIAVARTMLEELRGSVDQAFRYGGEEFCALLPGVSAAEALAVGERLRKRIQNLRIPHQSSSVAPHLTASIGVALRETGSPMSNQELTEYADKALYRAKTSGRNQVCFYNPAASSLPGETAL